VYSADEVERALARLRAGGNCSQVSRETGISRAALRAWALGRTSTSGRPSRRAGCLRCDDYRFCEYCDKVGVEWRPTNRWNISVARRDSVALMDRHIGPKR